MQRNDSGTTAGDLLRLASDIQSRIRGMSPSALALLGEEQLQAMKKTFDAADVKIRAKAAKVKETLAMSAANGAARFNHELSVDDLVALGEQRLDELTEQHSYDSYDLNAVSAKALLAK